MDVDGDQYPGISYEDYLAVFEATPELDPADLVWPDDLFEDVDLEGCLRDVDEVHRDGVTPKTYTGITLLFDLDAGAGEIPTEYLWSGGSSNPMGHAIDMIPFSTGFYVLFSCFQESTVSYPLSITQLMPYKNTWTGWGFALAYYQHDWDYISDPYLDFDLQVDALGYLWGVAIGDSSLHWYQVRDAGSDFVYLDGDAFSDWTGGGEVMLFDVPSRVLVYDDGTGTSAISLVGYSVVDVPPPWDGEQLVSSCSHDGWTVVGLGGGGVLVTDEVDLHELFAGIVVSDADAVFFDSDGDGFDEVYTVAVYDADTDGLREVVLRHGDPAVLTDGLPGTVLHEVVFELDDGVEHDVTHAGIHVDDDRVFLGATAEDLVDWLFMSWPRGMPRATHVPTSVVGAPPTSPWTSPAGAHAPSTVARTSPCPPERRLHGPMPLRVARKPPFARACPLNCDIQGYMASIQRHSAGDGC